MEALWFALVALMLAVYAVLDGYDFGAGALHLFVARTDVERREVFAAIGPFWDGNEVWLLAGGGTFFFAFPRAYAAAFSGFYLPLMLVLWLLIARGISIDVRSHERKPLWRAFFDVAFALSSALMAVVLGAAIGNVVRGVPLDASGQFHVPFFTDFTPGKDAGVLDWYTTLVGVFTLAALAGHGAHYLAWKTRGGVNARALVAGRWLWRAALALFAAVTLATWKVQPALFAGLAARPWSFALVALAAAGLALALTPRAGRERRAFFGSSLFLFGILGATAAAIYPDILRSSIDPAFSITAQGAAAGAHGLRVGLGWWGLAIPLAVGYFAYLFRMFSGKVTVSREG